jgi:hypothetical protein
VAFPNISKWAEVLDSNAKKGQYKNPLIRATAKKRRRENDAKTALAATT